MDGKRSAARVLDDVTRGVAELLAAGGRRPHLAVILVGDNPASETYVGGKRRDGVRVGITSSDHRLPDSASTQEVMQLVQRLNRDPNVSGILVQQPFPKQVEVTSVVEGVDPEKDVDGFHPINLGRLALGEPGLVACTAAGVMRMLDDAGIPLAGARAVVLGRSNIVGKPAALLLLARNATVTICHSRTRDLPGVCREADVLVVAVGRPGFVTKDFIKPGAAVVDVGVNRVDGRIRGDVDEAVAEVAGHLSPVPGGVGRMTRAMLMWNTLEAERRRQA
ncbi:MAG: bifunctional 5,10-methylenetetrahydrofolate dehydrogenase/5,10-methenyltetrahydrofolate cyclohydrolase [Candidatus Dormibacteraeota bacterium]|uniref:Bifunctional protein FolD n=1 Tax=Candidatus Dormiibacter inghamiae TaxID=3127013 RepID=A0A934NHQ2_9BACT|nr:bifunctional 5,10-methylenetetrahydrofolate dehydrogenase/5,10-methenyltetrahydrofolate cyclohydrolase [Candidatus Dormibacteraeota bacterium]MBJ7606326.1 bifunctional 5,10-methylenetetrahydrofolate dehydrogenase/5,10-methenyltetrahydrofolate cyclohydrolase [Candidatus Dormibacteraeota bacterium]